MSVCNVRSYWTTLTSICLHHALVRHLLDCHVKFLWKRNIALMIATIVFQAVVIEEVWKKSPFSTNISLYLGNDTRFDHSYNGRRIGSRSRISVYLMVTSTMTLSDHNPDFKVSTRLFRDSVIACQRASWNCRVAFRLRPVCKCLNAVPASNKLSERRSAAFPVNRRINTNVKLWITSIFHSVGWTHIHILLGRGVAKAHVLPRCI